MRAKSPVRVEVVVVIGIMVVEVMGAEVTVPEAGITALMGMGAGATVMGTAVVVPRVRTRPKSPVRVAGTE